MATNTDHDDLRAAAEAARKSLERLTKERDELNRRLAAVLQPISMLQNVISAWEQIDPQAAAQSLLLPDPKAAPERAARGEITEKVFEIMGDKQPRSPQALHHEIRKRYNLDPSINAVSVALRRGAERGKFEQIRRGEYVLR